MSDEMDWVPQLPSPSPSADGEAGGNGDDEPAAVDSAAQLLPSMDDRNSTDDRADDTDQEDNDAANSSTKPRKISERKRADNAAFDMWVEENQHKLSEGQRKPVVDADKSLQSLVRDFENKRIIASPRDYQLELFERAKKQNTIAVLDTGGTFRTLFAVE